jgi:carbonic anhydrase/acetyltransferase-like protein (isoleucine patch superfamily)
MLIKSVNGKAPSIPKDCYVAENATIIGDVTFGAFCSVWFNAVVRGDVNFISIGNKVNIQDGAIIHCTYLKHPTIIGNNVSIGSNATILPVKICDDVVIGAGSVVTKNIEFSGVYAGNPARLIRKY